MAAVFNRRDWLATVAVIVLVLVVWKVIDYRMRPLPPPNRAIQPGER